MKYNFIPRDLKEADKFGNFTLPELGVIGVGVFIVMVNLMLFDFFISLFFNIPVAILTFLIIRLRINDLPAYQYLFIWLIYQTQPKQLLYRTDNRKVINNEELLIEFTEHENLFEDEIIDDEDEYIPLARREHMRINDNKRRRARIDDEDEYTSLSRREYMRISDDKKRRVRIDDDEDFFA